MGRASQLSPDGFLTEIQLDLTHRTGGRWLIGESFELEGAPVHTVCQRGQVTNGGPTVSSNLD